ncbi:hypothetical protein MPTK1_5g14940 [Marchantia polymorpha subsp. ruderalis]|uniref:Transferrin-like domain-containing protein n=2 Tax=Marchantia polymorpha TaxID=3197 RepID=A0AAF6BIH5_MARPO|nr:hypothetical protein MARPO_0229s0001 [Marchantia polymorpha]BBN11809.1 hypothetical protein Mp_5g14940 [Marchantia polymorpha subsp. ruderalis]|eukprot:PTQ27054.1 hypothetical protein MARPO_0229s0001 [Marchantia polymorpha]
MASRTLLSVLLFALFVSAAAQNATDPPVSAEDEDWGWCVTTEGDNPTCQSLITILADLDPEATHKYSCIVGDGAEDCMKKINNGDAKFGVFDGGNIRKASNTYNLKPIRIEITGTSTDRYFSVGVVKKDNCPRNINDLKGKRTCHSGYGRAAGWTIPITYLVDSKIIPVVTSGPAQNDIESVKAFFSKTCAASNDQTKAVCSACKTTTGCTQEDIYYDYEGAFRGVVEDSCDIAFTKHSIPIDYASNGQYAQTGWTGLGPASDYALLCPTPLNGAFCTDVANYADCNFGNAPPHTIFVASDWPAVEVQEFQAVLDAANNDPAFNALLFQGKNTAGSIFVSDATKTLAYSGTVDALVAPIEKAATSLEAINAAKPPAGAAAGLLPSLLGVVAAATSGLVLAAAL